MFSGPMMRILYLPGLIPLLEFGVDHSPAARHERMEKLRTSTAQSRSTVYDKEIGIT